MIDFFKEIHIGDTLYIVNGKDIFEIEIDSVGRSKNNILEFYFYINWIYYSYTSGRQELIDLDWKTVASDLEYLQLHIVDSSKPNLFRSNLARARLYRSLDAAEAVVCTESIPKSIDKPINTNIDWINQLEKGDQITSDNYYFSNSKSLPNIKIGTKITIKDQKRDSDVIKIFVKELNSEYVVGKQFLAFLFIKIPNIFKTKLDQFEVGKYYQCIEDCSIFQKKKGHSFNIIKIVRIQESSIHVTCPNFRNPEEIFYLRSNFEKFKPYQYEQLSKTPESESTRPGSAAISIGCQGSISPSTKRLVGNPQRIDFNEIEVGYSYVSKTVIMVHERGDQSSTQSKSTRRSAG